MRKYDLGRDLNKQLKRNLTTGANPTRLYFLSHGTRTKKGRRKAGGQVSFHHGVLTMDGGATIGVLYDIDALEKARIASDNVYLPLDDDQLEYIRLHLINTNSKRSKIGKRVRALFKRLTRVVRKNPTSNARKDLEKENERLNKELSFYKGSHADVLGLMAGQLPCPPHTIARLPTGMDWVAVYTENGEQGDYLAIDLLEMNYMNDEGEVAFTENQRKQMQLIKSKQVLFRLLHGTVSIENGNQVFCDWELIHEMGKGKKRSEY